jgi:hypothetical protein
MEAMEKWGKNRRGWVQRIRGIKNVTILFGYCFELFLDFLLSTFLSGEWVRTLHVVLSSPHPDSCRLYRRPTHRICSLSREIRRDRDKYNTSVKS